MTRINFYDRFSVDLLGDAPVIDNLRKTYEHFEDPQDSSDPDLVVEVARTRQTPETVYGGNEAFFGRSGDWFLIQEGHNNYLEIDEDWRHIRTSPGNIHHHIAYVTEFQLRKQLSAEGKALLHASGVRSNGQTMLFPAWRHAGKTNTLMTFLADGADYLSDDRVWVDAEGNVDGYPLPINVMDWNDEMFDVDPDLDSNQQLRADVSKFVFEHVDQRRSIVDKLAYHITNQFVALNIRYRLLGVGEIVPGAAFVPESEIDRMLLLCADPAAQNYEVRVEAVQPENAFDEVCMISFYEWNRRLYEYFGVFDMLFPQADRLSELEHVIDAEEAIFAEMVDAVPIYRAHLPRAKDWVSTGISSQILQKFQADD